MRLLLVAESSTVHTHKWAQHFHRQGADVLVISQSPDPVRDVQVVQFPSRDAWWGGLPKARFGGGWQRWLAGWPSWQRLVTEFQPDVTHIYYISGQARDRFYYRRSKNLVVSTHGSDVVFDTDNPPSKSLTHRIRSLLSQASVVTATSHFLADRTRHFLDKETPIHVIPFGVDCQQFSPRESETRDPSRPIVLGFVKHLERKYGPDVLLESFAEINLRAPSTRLVMAGRGSMRDDLALRAVELGIAEKVEFRGQVEHRDVPEMMRSFDIFVMPSVCLESFGVAALEASACALPVVASNVGGIPETVVHGQTGVLVNRGDPLELARACLKIVEEPRLGQQLGKAGREFVLDHYQWHDTAARMEKIYESLLQA